MQEALLTAKVSENENFLIETVQTLLGFTLSEKLKFAIKTSLAMTLAYLIPFSQGWAQAQTAVITIMLIAVAGPVTESISKGLYRVVGTVIGAIIGMTLIAVFPQDRELYLISLSLLVTFTLYLTRAYKGDNTIFMLTAVTMMMVFQNGEVDDVFLYGLDKTFMTIFGIALYTFIGVFLWPVKSRDETLSSIASLIDAQSALYTNRNAAPEVRQTHLGTIQEKEKKLETAVVSSISEETSLSLEQKNTLLINAKEINELVILLSYHNEAHEVQNYTRYVSNYTQADEEITALFKALKAAAKNEKVIEIPEKWEAVLVMENIKALSHIDRAALTTHILEMGKLHEKLRETAEKFNAVLSPYPTSFTLTKKANPSKFNWFDVEDMKGSLITFMIFWVTTFFWIIVNPPAGFLVVTLATALSVITTFSPVKPSLLIIVFTFSFVFATVMYVLVLPHVVTAWELGLFIFFYAFIGFYFIKPMISIFFLLGMAVLGLSNPMYYNFNLFLLILFVFYLFLFVLLLFYYVPFSTKPEVLFRVMKQRFFHLSANLLKRSNNLLAHRGSFLGRLKAWYAHKHLMNTVKKMQLWASKTDTEYFDTLERETLMEFTKECETFAYLIKMMYAREISSVDNALIQRFKDENRIITLADVMEHYAKEMETKQLDSQWRDPQKIIDAIEAHLADFFSRMKSGKYSQEEIIRFYELIALRRNVWVSFYHCQKFMEELDFKVLERSRF